MIFGFYQEIGIFFFKSWEHYAFRHDIDHNYDMLLDFFLLPDFLYPNKKAVHTG
jgi:hypothetical protein